MCKRVLFLFAFSLFFFFHLNAQYGIRYPIVPKELPDSTDIAYYGKKKPINAIALNFTLNMGVWSFDRYVKKSDYAYINKKTIKKNLRDGFAWDNDAMDTNMFMHPLHGSLYFNSARSNGYNYWQSGAFAVGGSLMWEVFMENEPPSTNDIIITPIGGMAMGEVFYRASDLVLHDRATGSERFGRELASFVIAPTKGLTRLITGDMWKVRPTSGREFGIPNMNLDLSMGIRDMKHQDEIWDNVFGMALGLNIEYGERFNIEKERPYDFFTFKTNLNVLGTQPFLSQLNIMGRLHVDELIDNEKDLLSFGVYQHFDYYNSDSISSKSKVIPYRFSTPAAVGVGLMYTNKRFKNWTSDASAHLTGILLGASLSDHYKVDSRDYNLANGYGWKANWGIRYKDKFSFRLLHEAYNLYTWDGYSKDIVWDDVQGKHFDAQGDESHDFLYGIGTAIDVKLKDRWFLNFVYNSYSRKTNYRDYESVTSRTHENRLMLTYKF